MKNFYLLIVAIVLFAVLVSTGLYFFKSGHEFVLGGRSNSSTNLSNVSEESDQIKYNNLLSASSSSNVISQSDKDQIIKVLKDTTGLTFGYDGNLIVDNGSGSGMFTGGCAEISGNGQFDFYKKELILESLYPVADCAPNHAYDYLNKEDRYWKSVNYHYSLNTLVEIKDSLMKKYNVAITLLPSDLSIVDTQNAPLTLSITGTFYLNDVENEPYIFFAVVDQNGKVNVVSGKKFGQGLSCKDALTIGFDYDTASKYFDVFHIGDSCKNYTDLLPQPRG